MTRRKFKLPKNINGIALEYQGWERWSGNRWAWEFLRRNPKFQVACDMERAPELDASVAAKLDASIAAEFGMHKFQHYKKNYLAQSRARFFTSVRYFLGKKKGVMKIRVRPGQVAIVVHVGNDISQQIKRVNELLTEIKEQLAKKKVPIVGAKLQRIQSVKDPTELFSSLVALDIDAALKTNAATNSAVEYVKQAAKGTLKKVAICTKQSGVTFDENLRAVLRETGAGEWKTPRDGNLSQAYSDAIKRGRKYCDSQYLELPVLFAKPKYPKMN